MNIYIRSMIAGLAATVVLSLIMMMKAAMGLMAPVMTLILHLIWGAVLGFVFRMLPEPAQGTVNA